MTVVTFPRNERPEARTERLWTLYVMARQTAETSSRLEDGIAAGGAWAVFMREFEH